MTSSQPTVRLTVEEWTSLIVALVVEIGVETAKNILRNALGVERADMLIEQKSGERLSKAENHAIIRELYPHIPGADRAAKIEWLVATGRQAFASDARFAEVLVYVRQRVEEFEAAGGTIDAMPPEPEPEPAVEGVDLSRAEWWAKSTEKAADWPVVGGIRISNVNGSTFDINQDGERLRGKYQVIAYFVWRDGRWLGGGFDGCGNEPFGMKRKTWGNAKTGVPGKHKGGNEQANRDKVKIRKGDAVVLCLLSTGSKTRTPASLCFEYPTGKEIDPASLSPSAVIPDVEEEIPAGTFAPPPRTGEPSYVGVGDINKWLEIPGDNPRKSVSLSCWAKFNRWPRTDMGAMLINKGLVGHSWAYGLCVRPSEIAYKATAGDVAAAYRFAVDTWYHVRIDATANAAAFWVNGQPLKVTRKETGSLFSQNADPVRIGGCKMPWNPPSAWFNGSLDGEMCDWKVEIT